MYDTLPAVHDRLVPGTVLEPEAGRYLVTSRANSSNASR